MKVRVYYLDTGGNLEIAGGDLTSTLGRQVKRLRAFGLDANYNPLQVQDEVPIVRQAAVEAIQQNIEM